MRVVLISLIIASIVLFTGCGSLAKDPSVIMPKQEPNKYMEYSCSNLEKKANEITSQTMELKQELELDSYRDTDAYLTGLFITWPALLAIQGDDEDLTNIYSKVKGELLNIQEADMLNECNIQFSKDTLSIVNIY